MKRLTIDSMYGACPMQAEGRYGIDPWYFRSRGSDWSFGIGGDPVGASMTKRNGPNKYGWRYGRYYGEWPSAGWIDVSEALEFIAEAIREYDAHLKAQPPEHTNKDRE